MGYFLLCLLVCCAVFNADVLARSHSKKAGGRIVGGQETTIENYPYQAYLLLQKADGYYQCGGSIISPDCVLTASHCLEDVMKVTVRIGSTISNSGGLQYDSKSIKLHPKYNKVTKDYDVGVVCVKQHMALNDTNAKAIKLPPKNDGGMVPANETITLTGWGATSQGGPTTTTLMTVDVQTHSLKECMDLLPGLTKRMFCAGPIEGGKDSCQGDSGGPAVHDGVQWGIVSFGYGCAKPKKPGVYTYVAAVRTWIKSMASV